MAVNAARPMIQGRPVMGGGGGERGAYGVSVPSELPETEGTLLDVGADPSVHHGKQRLPGGGSDGTYGEAMRDADGGRKDGGSGKGGGIISLLGIAAYVIAEKKNRIGCNAQQQQYAAYTSPADAYAPLREATRLPRGPRASTAPQPGMPPRRRSPRTPPRTPPARTTSARSDPLLPSISLGFGLGFGLSFRPNAVPPSFSLLSLLPRVGAGGAGAGRGGGRGHRLTLVRRGFPTLAPTVTLCNESFTPAGRISGQWSSSKSSLHGHHGIEYDDGYGAGRPHLSQLLRLISALVLLPRRCISHGPAGTIISATSPTVRLQHSSASWQFYTDSGFQAEQARPMAEP
ncbi:hypothetical protein DFH09DRAFT_1118882 [Mycena vulgaris]|nr:hypothetical protein DFH09DRAFT_1118882 [Mycena vulgaris]